MRVKRLGYVLVLVLLVSATLGCNIGGLIGSREDKEVVPTEAPVEGEEATATEVAPEEPAEEPPTEEAIEEEKEEEEEVIDLSGVTEGLQQLDSYRSRFDMTFDGESEGEMGQWSLTMEMAYVRDPFAQHIVLKGGEMGVDLEEGFETIQIGNRHYMILGEGECISHETEDEEDDQDLEIFDLDDVMGQLEGARRVRPDEEVNGVTCRHYVFDEYAVDWPELSLSKARGELWIAVDGDYVVKYTMEAEGQNPATHEEGRMEWVYEVYDVNKPINIEPPASCEGDEAQYPMMSDATNIFSISGMLSYQSASSFDEVIDFYQQRMPEEGWEDTGESFISEGSAILEYVKDGQTINLSISETDEGISVTIFEG